MTAYFIRRLLFIPPTLIGMTLAVFFIIRFTPGGPMEQALLEAPDLKTRADVLVALTEMALGKTGKGAKPRLQ